MFRSLKVMRKFSRYTQLLSKSQYHPINPIPNAFMAIYLDAKSAQEIVAKSPLRYRLLPEKPQQTKALGEDTDEAPSSATASHVSPADRIFELIINRSDFNHHKYISDPKFNPLHGNFRPEIRSAFSNSLARILPETLWTEGLMDWETDSLRRRKWMEERRQEDGSLAKHVVGVHEDHQRRFERSQPGSMSLKQEVPWRLQYKWMKERAQKDQDEVPRVMKGLKSLWEERERERQVRRAET